MRVHAFKDHNFSTKSFFLRENLSGNVREAESRFGVCVRRTMRSHPYERIKSQLFSDFSRFPFPGMESRAHTFLVAIRWIWFKKCRSRRRLYFCVFDIMRKKFLSANAPFSFATAQFFYVKLCSFFFFFMPTAALMSMVPEFVSTAARSDGSNCVTHSKGLRSYRVWMVFFFFFLCSTVCVGNQCDTYTFDDVLISAWKNVFIYKSVYIYAMMYVCVLYIF